jgi:altronate dehydratase
MLLMCWITGTGFQKAAFAAERAGNDIVAITNLTAAGVHMILFTTGRGTPLGRLYRQLK